VSLLTAGGLRLRLGERQVLDGVSLEMAAGELVGLIGANGAGKSSLMRCLSGLVSADDGYIQLDGKPMGGHSALTRARTLAYLPQGSGAHWPLAVRDLVALGRLPWQPPWSGLTEGDRAAVDTAMALCDVRALAGRRVNTLSGGERARTLLARALAGEPRLLLADEPVAGIDPAHQIAVMELLASRARDGCATLVVLHDLNLAARYCSRLVLMHEGTVVAEGGWREVLTPAHLERTLAVRLFVSEGEDGPVVVPLSRA
jgi:iron complex transport system ATP-binding protein